MMDTATCAIRDDDTLWCWGRIFWHENTADTKDYFEPTPVPFYESERWATIGAGRDHICGIMKGDDENGTLWCWGKNIVGQVGDGRRIPRRVPRLVVSPRRRKWARVCGGANYSCALDEDRALWCWGSNETKQLGVNREDLNIPAPSDPKLATLWQSINCGDHHACALDMEGGLWCWGYNAHGQLGNGTVTWSAKPIRVGGHFTWRQVTAGLAQTCGITEDGTLWCWGREKCQIAGYHQILDMPFPTQVGNDTGWKVITTGDNHYCGIRGVHETLCWCANSAGQIGDGTTIGKKRPVRIAPEHAFQHIQTRNNRTCAIRDDNTPWCWGENRLGQLGDGTRLDRYVPTRVVLD